MPSDSTIAFIGGGNMATSLIGGLLARSASSRQSIVVADPIVAQRERMEATYGVRTVADAVLAAQLADVLVLAVKPQQMAGVARAIGTLLDRRRPLVISIAAGISLSDLARWLDAPVPIVRTMPNRPALVGAGVTALFAGPGVDDAARAM
jgi:pyrroline-5-carboxylate reductase